MSIPDDNPQRQLALGQLDGGLHLSVAGDTYTVLISGEQTAGRYCLIDMHIAPNAGPPPHRHDFEEMFSVLEGEVVFTFRGESSIVHTGQTVNIPANAPHYFRNVSGRPARLLCMASPAGLDEFFARVGDKVETATSPPPKLTSEEQAERKRLVAELSPQYRTEMV